LPRPIFNLSSRSRLNNRTSREYAPDGKLGNERSFPGLATRPRTLPRVLKRHHQGTSDSSARFVADGAQSQGLPVAPEMLKYIMALQVEARSTKSTGYIIVHAARVRQAARMALKKML
jgi:hypothetical protein